MPRPITLVVAAVLAVAAAQSGAAVASSAAPAAASACTGSVGWQSAATLVGKTASIRGRVVGAEFARSSFGSPTFLHLGAAYPSAKRVTVVIWIENRSLFGRPEQAYKGKTICVRGVVKSFSGVAHVELRDPSQLSVAR